MARAGSLATWNSCRAELSYNNIADADAAWECVRQFDAPACVIVKHANPCGVAVGSGCRCLRAGLRHRSDQRIRRHHRVQHAARRRHRKTILDRQFVEVLIAPDYDDDALAYAKKANVRVLRIPMAPLSPGFIDTKRINRDVDADRRRPRGGAR